MGMIKGITVTLITDGTQTGTDGFGRPIYGTATATVSNVLVRPVSESEILSNDELSGKRLICELAIPKGDSHTWKDAKVTFQGATYRQIGDILEGIDDLIPLDWNKKVRVEKIDA